MKNCLISLLFIPTIGSTGCFQTLPSEHGRDLIDYKLHSVGWNWTVHTYVPKGGRTTKPLVIVLHGAGGSGDRYLTGNNWIHEADAGDFIAIAPDGLPARPRFNANFMSNPRVWNSGQLKSGSARALVDDVQFIADLIEDAKKRFPVNPKYVFMTGHSNGTGMTFKFASSHPEMLTAIGPALGQCYDADRPLSKGLPTLYMLGSEDPLNPLRGGTRKLPWGESYAPPVQQSIDSWAKALLIQNPARVIRDDATVRVEDYGAGKDSATFQVWFLKGQGHAWPGGKDSGLPERVLGPNPSKVNATQELWQFFKRFVK